MSLLGVPFFLLFVFRYVNLGFESKFNSFNNCKCKMECKYTAIWWLSLSEKILQMGLLNVYCVKAMEGDAQLSLH